MQLFRRPFSGASSNPWLEWSPGQKTWYEWSYLFNAAVSPDTLHSRHTPSPQNNTKGSRYAYCVWPVLLERVYLARKNHWPLVSKYANVASIFVGRYPVIYVCGRFPRYTERFALRIYRGALGKLANLSFTSDGYVY